MIRRIYSSDPRFKTLSFGPGLNVLLADKSPGATERQTRNRAGKSSSLEVLHYLLGATRDKESVFHGEALEGVSFGMDFDLGGVAVCVERTVETSSPVRLKGELLGWPFPPSTDGKDTSISNDQWKSVLGRVMFGLEDGPKHGPSFRSLIGYFARRERSGGMAKAVANSIDQQIGNQQVNVSFLLGLDWTVPHAWHAVRERENQLKQLKKSLSEGTFGHVVGSASAMKSELVIAQDRADKFREAVASFRVEERYAELEKEASKLTRQLSSLADENTLDRRYVAQLEQTSAEEHGVDSTDLQALYREAGVVLPDAITKRFDEVAAFHDSVVRNRRSYLASEIQGANDRILQREREQSALDARRAEVMTILTSTGALEQFTALQNSLARAEARIETLQQRYATAEALESGNIKLRSERTQLLERLRRSYDDESDVIKEAILTFRRISSALYEDETAGTLTLTATPNGPKFDAKIPGAKSKGVNNMQIFCFDIMLMLLSLKRNRGPGFLVHDSHLFDGVDERQIGKALALGKNLAEKHGFQYIVTMNTDDVPKRLPDGLSLEAHALPVRLTDATEDGGLFGFRFN